MILTKHSTYGRDNTCGIPGHVDCIGICRYKVIIGKYSACIHGTTNLDIRTLLHERLIHQIKY